MWLRLGESELVNLDYVASIKKGLKNTIDIQFSDFDHARVLPFQEKEIRDQAFDKLVDNLVKLRDAME